MKVIQVVGRSNSGKTTLIKKLIPVLAQKGSVGVIKHLGDHTYSLAEGKDTTEFYSSGAAITIGIDAEKSVATLRSTSLEDSLRIFCGNGIVYAVIEGFKTHPYPRIVIGDLPGPGCLLRNPSVEEIIENLASFPDYQPTAERERKTEGGAL